MQKPGIFRTLSLLCPNAYPELCHIYKNKYTLSNPGNSEPWHTENPEMFTNLKYLKQTHMQDSLKDL